ncbi:MAG: nucleotidyl transferase AbiEii/AbiGii toxin family protein [Candidatus Riflebacteria bacterium]|nr:nucleotidyl transferase AbiEii/AbiGii toxin family protein [Candidatus Riflebacteria bacterium]
MKGRSNLAASVTARLLNRAKDQGIDFQILLTAYCFERFLFRLGAAGLRDRFVLKGAMLLQLWTDHPFRATRDLDLLRFGDGSFESIRQDLNSILTAQVSPDGVSFDGTGMAIEAIRAEDEYAGARATLSAQCGTAKISLQIDMGVGDAVWPAPVLRTYPGLLDLPSPEVLVYPLEAVVAEKFEAMVVLGERNSRIKDFFDLHHLATRFEFDRPTLAEAVRRTFRRRRTPVPPTDPVGLTADYWANPSRPAQVRAFSRRAGLVVPQDPGLEFTPILHAFLGPILDDIRTGKGPTGTWPPGGPWQ